MEEEPGTLITISVMWRGNKYVVGIAANAYLKDLGDELQKLTGVKADTMKLFVPQLSNKSSKMLSPFSDDQCGLSLHEASITEGKSLRMMGVALDEVDKVLQFANMDMRIAGFKEEEKRLMQRALARTPALKLPPGPYVFCDFQPLQVQDEIQPSPGSALRLMHKLASDPGIVAVMNKHRWRVGLMSEMAPVGLVGVSPKCILGLNKNQGEEISLRLRTDNYIGFRKYASIKKTLLHELAHMVYSEHDTNFYALDKQLNDEVDALDWTKSRGQTLSGTNQFHDIEEEYDDMDVTSFSHKLGGNVSTQLASARASSISAAYHRLANASTRSEGLEEPDPDDSGFNKQGESDSMDVLINSVDTGVPKRNQIKADEEPDPDEHSCDRITHEPYTDDSQTGQLTKILNFKSPEIVDEPDPDDKCYEKHIEELIDLCDNIAEPDPDESHGNEVVPHPEPKDFFSNDDPEVVIAKAESCQDSVSSQMVSSTQMDESGLDDEELRRIQDPVTLACERLRRAIETLRAEVTSAEMAAVLKTLLKIIRNAIEHPDEVKYKRLRKANPVIQRNVANFKAAMEILQMIGFDEDVIFDEIGKSETYLVLKRNDPGLLWLAKSSLEAYA